MKNKKKLSRNKYFYIILIFLTILILFIPSIISFFFFPKEINLIAGSTHKFNFDMKAIATIVPKDKSILKVNDIEIDEKIDIDLKKPVYIQSNKEGSHDMTLSVMGIPIKDVKLSVIPYTEVIPSGEAIGVQINTDGVMVLDVGSFVGEGGKEYSPAKNILKAGDMIQTINNTNIDNKKILIEEIEKSDTLNMQINRKGNTINTVVNLEKNEKGENQLGVWVRDSTQGVGTLTYINKDTKGFGALGHGIVDVDTREIMKVKDGKLLKSNILGIKKGEKGSPGELLGSIESGSDIGKITKNTNVGVYGKITNDEIIQNQNALPIGLRDEIKIDKASILCTLDDGNVEEYEIEIEGINKYNIDDSKSMIIKITDKELLEKTNGIVQGMGLRYTRTNTRIYLMLVLLFYFDR